MNSEKIEYILNSVAMKKRSSQITNSEQPTINPNFSIENSRNYEKLLRYFWYKRKITPCIFVSYVAVKLSPKLQKERSIELKLTFFS